MSTCNNTLETLKGQDILIKAGNGFAGNVTLTSTGGTVDFTDHGLSDGDQILFNTVNTTTTVVADQLYYVVNSTANSFQLSLTEGGTPVTIDVDGDADADEYFRDLGGIQDSSLSFAAELQETTNKSSNQFREILDKAGIKALTVSGSGFAVDDWGMSKLREIYLANCLWRFQICVDDGAPAKYWEGCFKVTAMEQGGSYNAAQTFSLTLESSGEFAYN